MAEPLKILVDANVWLDYGIATSENHESAVRFMVESAVNDVVLYVSSISLKDVFQLIVRRTKKELRNEGDRDRRCLVSRHFGIGMVVCAQHARGGSRCSRRFLGGSAR